MGRSPYVLAGKLCTAINHKFKTHVVLNSRKFYKHNAKRAVSLYDVKDSFVTEDGQFVTKKLFTTSSSAYVCCFLQELMKAMDGDSEFIPSNKGYQKSRDRGDVAVAIDYMVKTYGKD